MDYHRKSKILLKSTRLLKGGLETWERRNLANSPSLRQNQFLPLNVYSVSWCGTFSVTFYILYINIYINFLLCILYLLYFTFFLFIWSSFTQVRIFYVRSFNKLMFHTALEHRNCCKETAFRLFKCSCKRIFKQQGSINIFYRLWFISFGVSGLFLPLEANLFWLVLRVVLEDKLDIPGQRWNPKALEIMFVPQGLC